MSKEQANPVNANKATPSSSVKKTKKVEGTFADSWKPSESGESITGIYLGSQKAESDTGEFTAYHIKCTDGRRLSVAGAGLDTIMPQIPKKTEVTLTYGGLEKKGKGMMKVFDVQVDEGVTLLDPFDNEGDE